MIVEHEICGVVEGGRDVLAISSVVRNSVARRKEACNQEMLAVLK